MPEICAQHPEATALYRCDGCLRLLCPKCILTGHALWYCNECGQVARPLDPFGGSPSLPEASAERVEAGPAMPKPYSLREAFAYPFRGLGKFLFVAAVLCQGGVEILARFGTGLYRFVFLAAFWSLMVGLQLKIVRTTIEGQNELPDWPSYFSWGERFFDLMIYAIFMFWQVGPVALYTLAFRSALSASEPNLAFWIGFSVLAWLGIATGAMALGSTGRFMPDNVLRVDLHWRAFRACGGDAVRFANILFGLGATIWLARLGLAEVPYAGALAAGVLGTLWLFLSAHLAGLFFRRYAARVESIYP